MADGTRFHAARPTIILAGEDDRSLKDGLLEMIVVETTAGLRRCEARFGNWGSRDQGMGFLYFDRRKLEFGKALTIRIGNDLIFDGKITASLDPATATPELLGTYMTGGTMEVV